jgi:glutaminyl-tRNA synthetase
MTETPVASAPKHVGTNFITEIIENDLASGRYSRVVTRFPPEPNGYPHIGHAKSICLNFGLALDYGGEVNLRFDDTNPLTERQEYADAMIRDVAWLGFTPTRVLYSSDYFEQLYQCALQLIADELAYVDSVSDDEMRRLRGDVHTPGRPSPWRERSVAENLRLFTDMRQGKFDDGTHVLRAKIDLAHPNFKLRDPVLYRILKASHYRTGDAWPIYPLYDFAHPLEDFIEGISHSICTLEFENNRAIYDWLVENLRGKCGLPSDVRPYQYEFARFNLDYTLMSKRKLLTLVNEGRVGGWDDPRMPTISGMRRRGVRPEALRGFMGQIGVAKTNSRVELGLLEASIRDDLNTVSPRLLAVTKPLKVVITTMGEDLEHLNAPLWPHDVVAPSGARQTRPLAFGREVWIDRDDFSLNPPKGFYRLSKGTRVRLRHGYVICCDEVRYDAAGEVVELHCSHDPDTLGRNPVDGPAVKGVIQWVEATTAQRAEFRLYDRLFQDPDPEAGEGDFREHLDSLLNPASLTISHGYVEAAAAEFSGDTRFQFERLGYFWPDPDDSKPDALVYNRIIALRDGFSQKKPTTQATAQATVTPKSAQTPATPRPTPHHTTPNPAIAAQVQHYITTQGLAQAEAQVLAQEPALAEFFASAVAIAGDTIPPKLVAQWVCNELAAVLRNKTQQVQPLSVVKLLSILHQGGVTRAGAKVVLEKMLETQADPEDIIQDLGLSRSNDVSGLETLVSQVVAEFGQQVAEYKAGRTGLLGFLLGQIMRRSNNQADPATAKAVLLKQLA